MSRLGQTEICNSSKTSRDCFKMKTSGVMFPSKIFHSSTRTNCFRGNIPHRSLSKTLRFALSAKFSQNSLPLEQILDLFMSYVSTFKDIRQHQAFASIRPIILNAGTKKIMGKKFPKNNLRPDREYVCMWVEGFFRGNWQYPRSLIYQDHCQGVHSRVATQ